MHSSKICLWLHRVNFVSIVCPNALCTIVDDIQERLRNILACMLIQHSLLYFTHICTFTTQTLAEERLTLQELETPQGRKLNDKIKVDQNLGRWKFLWNGHDVVHKVVHW